MYSLRILFQSIFTASFERGAEQWRSMQHRWAAAGATGSRISHGARHIKDR